MCLHTNFIFSCQHNVLFTTQICTSDHIDPEHDPPPQCLWTKTRTERFDHPCVDCVSISVEQAKQQLHARQLSAVGYQRDLEDLALCPLFSKCADYQRARNIARHARNEREIAWIKAGRPRIYPMEKMWWGTQDVKVMEDTVRYYTLRLGCIPPWALPRPEVGRWWSGRAKGREELPTFVTGEHFARFGKVPAWAIDESEEGKQSYFEPVPLAEGAIFPPKANMTAVHRTEGVGGDANPMLDEDFESSSTNSGLSGEEASGRSEPEEGTSAVGNGKSKVKKRLVNKRLSGGTNGFEGILRNENGKQAEGTEKKSARKKVVWKRLSPT